MCIDEVKTLSCSNSWRNYSFLRVTTQDGTVGWSEFDENFGSPGVSAVIDKISGRLIGKNAFNHEFLREDLRNSTRPGAGGVVGQALGAIENALLDIKGKTLDVPCHELLGGKIRDRVRVYWSHFVTYRSRPPHYGPAVYDASGVRDLAGEAVERGFTGVKTNIFSYDEQERLSSWAPGFGRPFETGRNVEKATRRDLRKHLALIREAAGPAMDILLDLNFNARPEGILSILRDIDDLDLFWVEIDLLDPVALANIRAESRIPIASCETLIGLQQFLPFFQARAMDVAIVDTPWNGVWQSMKIAAAADAYEINVACHNFYGHLCTMMNAHFCAAVPNLRIMETDIDRVAWDQDLFTHVPEFQDGHMIIPDRPGWGTEPIEEALAAHPPLENAGMWSTSYPLHAKL